jgi:hypothetical protein
LEILSKFLLEIYLHTVGRESLGREMRFLTSCEMASLGSALLLLASCGWEILG